MCPADRAAPSGTGRQCGLHQWGDERLPCPVCAEMTEPSAPSGTGHDTAAQSRRFAVAMFAVVVPVGVLLAVTHAPLWLSFPWIVIGGSRAR